MDSNIDYLKILATVVVAILSWVVGHYFTSKRNKHLKRKELTTEYLINAYRILTNEISHRESNPERAEKLENILCDIQLFGTRRQVELAKNLANQIALGNVFELTPLIKNLRDELRKELGLKKVKGNISWLRFKNNSSLTNDKLNEQA